MTVGTLLLALAAGAVPAEAAPPPDPSAPLSAPPGRAQTPSPLPKAGPSKQQVKAAADAAAAPTTNDAVYAYDAAGRLVGVSDPDGETARYRYDAAGNRLGIDRFPSSALSVLSLVPVKAAPGAQVTLSGTGFSPSPAANTVSFGDKAAEVVSASAHRLVVKVPAGSVGGKVKVTVAGAEAQSAEAFTIAPSGPSVTKMEPTSGSAGTEVTLTGSGFATTATDNVVRFDGDLVAEVVGRTDTTLTVKVPPRATSGPVEVTTPDGTTTTANFSVQSAPAEFESTVVTSVTDADPPTIAVTTPGNKARILFDADQGDNISFGFTQSTFNAALNLSLYDPEGRPVDSGSIPSAGGDFDVRSLPQSGRYSLVVTPGAGNIGAARATLSAPTVTALDLTAPTAKTTIGRPGQDAHWTFTGTQGQTLSVGVGSAGMAKATLLRLYGPNGAEIADAYRHLAAKAATSLDIDALPAAGRYTLVLDPDGAGTGTLTVTGSPYAAAGTMDPAGPETKLVISRPGQDGHVSFAGQSGQRLRLGLKAETFKSGVKFTVKRPDGAVLDYDYVNTGLNKAQQLPALPATGTYTVVISPTGTDTGSLTMMLSQTLGVAQLAPTGGPVTVTIERLGQNAESVFQGTAGEDLSLAVTTNGFPTATYVSVIAPSGKKVVDDKYVGARASSTISMSGLPESGTYRVLVDPYQAGKGSLTLTLSADQVTPLTTTSAPTALNVARPGQRIRGTFTAATGDHLSLGLTTNTFKQTLYVRVTAPSGARIVDGKTVSTGDAATIGLSNLPETGAYTALIYTDEAGTGSLTLTLSADRAVPLTTTSASTVLTVARPGQRIRGTFTAAEGDFLSLGVTANTFNKTLYASVWAPAGAKIVDRKYIFSGDSGAIDLPDLPQAGIYTVLIYTDEATTGSLTLTLSSDTRVPLATDAPSSPAAASRAGQRIRGTFTAAAGDALSLGLTANSFSETVHVSVLSPTGTRVINNSTISGGRSATIGMAPLPETGTYTVLVDAAKAATGSVTLTLSKDLQAQPAIDGASTPVTISRAGQRIRVQFTAPATSSLGFALTGNTVTESTQIRLITPAGGTGTYLTAASPKTSQTTYLTGLTAGTAYTLLLAPDGAATGAMTLWLSTPRQAGTLTSTAPTAEGTTTRPGQELRFTYKATAGSGTVLKFTRTLQGNLRIATVAPDASVDADASYVSGTTGEVDLRAPLTAGTHQILVRPAQTTTGTVTATLVPDADGGTLNATGTKRPVALTAAAQNGHYTFAGTKGDKLTVVTDAPPFAWYLSVHAPDGTWLTDDQYLSTATVTKNLPALPATGTYTLTVDPDAHATGTLNLGLKKTGTAALQTATSSTAPVHKNADHHPVSHPAVLPTGADAWQPGKANLAGRDWITTRGKAPQAPPALRGPPGKTALTGHVLKLNGTPLAKVTVTTDGRTTRTDSQGRFLLPGISKDATTLVVDGSSANTTSRQYGRFDIRIHPQDGQTTDLGFPVWMTPLDTKHTVKFAAPAKADVVLKTPKIPGLEVRIPKGSVVRDERGKPVTELGITAIPIDRPPFPLPRNSVVPVYFTVQPGGTYVFPKGAQIVYPNYTREAPGTQVEFLDYDPKKKGWYVYGHGTVTPDGRQVVPDAKTRVWAFHGAMFNTDDWLPWLTSWMQDALDWLSGDPVELSTGLLTDTRTDLAVSDPLGSAEATRTYWQADTRKRAFGIGRDLIYNAFLHSQKQYQEVDLYLPGGSKVHFTRTSPGTGYIDAVFEPLDTAGGFKGSKILSKDGQWELRLRDGTVWVFPQYAPLKEIRDRHGNTTKITRLGGPKGDITQLTTPGGRWVAFGYDSDHRIVSAKDNTGRATAYTYDTSGRLETVTDPAGKVSRYTYDGTTNRIATATDARGIVYMTNTFDANGRVKEQTLTEGQKYAFEYTQTAAGKVTSSTVTEPGGAVRRVEFDADGYGIKDTQAHGTSLARTTTYTRAATSHRIDAVTDPYGRRTKITYDANGHITSTTELDGTPQARTTGTAVFDGPYDQPTKVTDSLGNTTLLGYDANGNLDTVTDPEGRVTKADFNSFGQLTSLTTADGATTQYTYRHHDLLAVKDAEGRTSSQFVDAAGRPTTVTDATGSASTVGYDKLNQPRTVTDQLGQALSLGYDDNGNLTTLTDARGNATTWTYDQADRPKTATDPYGSTAGFEYHQGGRLAKVTNRVGQVATAEYDLLGRPKTVKYGVDIAGQAESTVTYAYDAVDLPKTVSDTKAGTQSFTYDAYDRPKSVTGPTGTIGYDYDGADRRSQMTAAGVTTTYGYDKSSILTSVKTGTQHIGFGLDAVGREQTATLPSGITRTTGYDKTGTINSIAYTRGESAVGDLTYLRDARGQQIRLTGTLASVALPAAETGSVFGKDNRVTTFNGRTFTYDNEGQLKDDGKNTYTFNPRGQLTGVTKNGGPAASFGYDPLGTRISKTLGGATTKFLTDASNPHIEQNNTGQTTATVAASGLDQYLTRTENGQTQTYLTDALGTVVGLANPDGTIATRYTYDPYGQPTATGAASTNPYTFTGRESDGTGLLHYRNRYYDPETGRFISQDPIGHAGGTNLYQYALSSPTTYTDPSGNNPLLIGCVGGGLAEGLMDWGIQRLSGRKVDWGQVATSAAMGCAAGMLGAWGGAKWATVGCRNSFTEDTPVLMADGSHKPIKNVTVGDRVRATNPETGETGTRTVTALIQGSGAKQLVDITTDTSPQTGPLTATTDHPFWVPSRGQWADAGDLKAGQWLQTSTGVWTQITAVRTRTGAGPVYNLTVDDLHTYYVLAGQTPVLVHNSNGWCGPGLRTASEAGISPNDAKRIQNAADKAGQPIIVVGSRANGTPNPTSDWDYILSGPSRTRHSVKNSLPRGTGDGEGSGRGRDFWQSYNPNRPDYAELDRNRPYVVFEPRSR
ncbi:RHS repeat-associated core domain-containing protein [Streptomyces purpureus]|uniref:Hint domain-containing protein n=1 Tax=Streptomyces purpureus TaxID=1951 RepID=A0A918HJH8_9ACTN|nr:RHS repeat-associated core domain-containing protein [Streptomyces purpureus]GGT65671.1 hypothetical protein GCM10014713_68170 [Streptomyces purpureus]